MTSAEASGRLLINGVLCPGTVRSKEGKIAEVDLRVPTAGDVELPVVAPGLIDLHIHGYGGEDPLENLAAMARALAKSGTTAFQPTLFPAAPEVLGGHAAQVAESASKLAAGDGARCLGSHLEGPFVNPKSAGALPLTDLAMPSPEALRAILGPATGDARGIRTMTIAPELPGAAGLITELARCGVRASMGHSLASDADARVGAKAGATCATHLFNAMRGIHHRDVGLAGFALLESSFHAEIIGDLQHVGPRAVEMALRLRGPKSLCLVSDALRGAGTGCDVFHSHGRDHQVSEGAAYYPKGPERDAPQLAGSATGQLEQVRRLVGAGVVSLEEALTMGSFAPASALGMARELGVLQVGAHADWIVLDPMTLDVLQVVVAGRIQQYGAAHA